MRKAVSKLNNEQLQAVKHEDGPLLVIAGAGTGKTTVITERIKHLVIEKGVKPQEILALTFTEKAAREMEERVDIALPYGYTQMWISTFHSFCDRVLRREALHVGYDPKYKLLGEAAAIQLVRDNIFDFDLKYFRPLGNPNKFISGMLQHFSRLQDEDIAPSKYMDWATQQKLKIYKKKEQEDKQMDSAKWLELAKAYKKYDEIKTRGGYFDYGDLIVKTLHVFRQRKNVLAEYQKLFRYILVDEFQDTNFAQNELVKLLSGENGNITVVADDDQAIYRWRGAAVSNVVQFRKTFPKTKIVTLTKNYRSAQEILDKAYTLIQNNNPDRLEVVEKINKKLVSQVAKSRAKVEFIHSDRVENEAERVAEEVVDLIAKGRYEYRDVAILVRANNHSEPFVRALSRNGVPYQFLGPGRLFKQPEIIDLISYLKVLNNFDDSTSMFRLLSIDNFGISIKDLVRVGNHAKRYNLSFFDACETVDSIAVSSDTKEKISKIVGIINSHIKLIKKETAGQILYYFLEETGLMKDLLSPDSIMAERKATNISKFFDKIKTYEVDHEDATVSAVVDWIELSSEIGESPLATDVDWTDINAVNILTIHSSKGLEFPVVFLVNLVSQRFPTVERKEQIPIPEELIKEVLPTGDYHLQEERRLFYVGMTRARERVYLTAADYYGEGKREKRLSPFVYETLSDKIIALENSNKVDDQLSFLGYKKGEQKPLEVERLRIDYLSYSQIETFKICPLHYKLRYILNVPTLPSAALSFGSSIHECMREFYESVMRKEKPSTHLVENILKVYWIKEGYKSKSHEEKSLRAAKRYLFDYLKSEFDPRQLPLALEKNFVLPIKIDGGGGTLRVGGKIDRIDRLPDGKIEIIDYKTGANVPTQKQVDTNLQLDIYALAATTLKESPFNKKPEDVVLSLYYFESKQKISTTRSSEQIEKAKGEIIKTKKEIEVSDFSCSGGALCKDCEYSIFCRSFLE